MGAWKGGKRDSVVGDLVKESGLVVGVVSPHDGWAGLLVASDLTCHWKSPVSAGSWRKYPGKTTQVSTGAGHMLDLGKIPFVWIKPLVPNVWRTTDTSWMWILLFLVTYSMCAYVAESVRVWPVSGLGLDWSVGLIGDTESWSVCSPVIWKNKINHGVSVQWNNSLIFPKVSRLILQNSACRIYWKWRQCSIK